MQELYPVENKVINLPQARAGAKKPAGQSFKLEGENFHVPVFENLIKQLNDFCQTQHRIALLLGPKGSGKTKLLKLFQACHANCHILNHSNGKLFHPNTGKEKDENLDYAFEQIVLQFDQASQGVLLLIDNADLLSVEQFNLIIRFCATGNNPNVKIILAGDENLSRRVMKLFETDFPAVPYTAIPIAPLSFPEMKHFLKQAFYSSKEGRKLLGKKNLEKIYQLSKGYPGRVNNVAAQLLSELSGRSVRPSLKKKKIWYVDLFILLSIVVLLLSITLQVAEQAKLFKHDQASIKSPPVAKDKFILPPPANNAIAIDDLAAPSYIASIEDSPEEMIQVPAVDLPEPEMFH